MTARVPNGEMADTEDRNNGDFNRRKPGTGESMELEIRVKLDMRKTKKTERKRNIVLKPAGE